MWCRYEQAQTEESSYIDVVKRKRRPVHGGMTGFTLIRHRNMIAYLRSNGINWTNGLSKPAVVTLSAFRGVTGMNANAGIMPINTDLNQSNGALTGNTIRTNHKRYPVCSRNIANEAWLL